MDDQRRKTSAGRPAQKSGARPAELFCHNCAGRPAQVDQRWSSGNILPRLRWTTSAGRPAQEDQRSKAAHILRKTYKEKCASVIGVIQTYKKQLSHMHARVSVCNLNLFKLESRKVYYLYETLDAHNEIH